MEYQKFKNLLHPVRLQIMFALRRCGSAATREIALQCPDVPPATLYRQLKVLLREGILKVERENRVNGIAEKIYQLAEDLPAEAEASAETDLMGLALNFSLSVLNDFHAYLHGRSGTREHDIGLRSEFFRLDPEELCSMARDMNRALQPYLNRPSTPERKLYRLSTVVVPISDDASDQGNGDAV